jgi:transcriptional regulator with XRE-family HTH domain
MGWWRVASRAGTSVRQRRVAVELKRLRELALLTADEVAGRLGWSASKVSRVENAKIRLKPDDVERLLGLYKVDGEQRSTLLSLVAADGSRKWWDAYADILTPDDLTLISFEAEASTALSYEPMVVPGLLQTEAYARRIIYMWQSLSNIPPPDMERRLEVRMTRQQVLTSGRLLELTVVIDEAVLRRQIDKRSVMREQLLHLAEMSELPNVEIRILPLVGEHLTSTGPLMSLRIPDFGDVVYLEDFLTGRLYIDDAALIYQHTLVFEQLSEAALAPDASRELIMRTIDELWADKR